jgi:hypothetical protein
MRRAGAKTVKTPIPYGRLHIQRRKNRPAKDDHPYFSEILNRVSEMGYVRSQIGVPPLETCPKNSSRLRYQIATKTWQVGSGSKSWGIGPFTSHLNNLIFACRVLMRSWVWRSLRKTTSAFAKGHFTTRAEMHQPPNAVSRVCSKRLTDHESVGESLVKGLGPTRHERG